MKRREFVTVGCCSVCGMSIGCIDESSSTPVPEIVSLEIQNDQRGENHEFLVQIEDREETVFEETYHLEAAGSGESGVALDNPVEPGAYTVRVEADGHSATVNVQKQITNEQTCIRLQFYLSSETLHSEYQLYDQCG